MTIAYPTTNTAFIVDATEGSVFEMSDSSPKKITGTLINEITLETLVTLTAKFADIAKAGVTITQGSNYIGSLKIQLDAEGTTFTVLHAQGVVVKSNEDITIGTKTVAITTTALQDVVIQIKAESDFDFESWGSSSGAQFLLGTTQLTTSSDSAAVVIKSLEGSRTTTFSCRVLSGTFLDTLVLTVGSTTVTPSVGNIAMSLAGEINSNNIEDAMIDKALQTCLKDKDKTHITTDPYQLNQKKYQRVLVKLDGNRPSRATPYTTELVIQGVWADNGVGKLLGDSSSVPISMTVTPGPTVAKRTTMTYVVKSSPYFTNEQCYIDCALSLPGYSATDSAANAGYGYSWAESASNVVYKNCHTQQIVTEYMYASPQGKCGDCTTKSTATEDADDLQCAGIPVQTLEPVRNTPIQLTITPRDNYGTKTVLTAGSRFVVVLQETGLLKQAVANITKGVVVGAALESAPAVGDTVRIRNAPDKICGTTGVFAVTAADSKTGYTLDATMTDVTDATLCVIARDPLPVSGELPLAQNDGTYFGTITPPSVGSFSLTIQLQYIDPTNQLTTLQSPILGSSFDVTAVEPTCPPNTKVKGLTGACQCIPGFGEIMGGAAGGDEEMTTCSPCAKGKYKKEIGNSLCDACPLGKAADEESSTECKYCPAGKDTSSGPSVCTKCQVGKFRAAQSAVLDPITGAAATGTMCKACATGFVALAEAATVCVVCPGGKLLLF